MRILVQTIIVFGLFLLGCSANNVNAETSSEAEKNIEQTEDSTEVYQEYLAEKLNPIREYVSHLDSISEWPLMQSVQLELNGQMVTAEYFLKMSDLLKIKVISQDVTSQGEYTYYFKDNKIEYAYEKGMEEMGEDGLVLVKNESFFEDGMLIRSLNNQDCGSPFNQEYRDAEQVRIMQDVNRIKAAFYLR